MGECAGVARRDCVDAGAFVCECIARHVFPYSRVCPARVGRARWVRVCREPRSILADPRLHGRPVVYYTYANPTNKTNAAFALASYLMLVTGCTPEEA